jgi:hypothetical protein
MAAPPPTWRIPLLIRTDVAGATGRQILLGEAEEEQVEVAAHQLCLVNAGQAAFCRVTYDWSLLQQIGQNLPHLGTVVVNSRLFYPEI